MKYIKTYENKFRDIFGKKKRIKQPNVGDYVITKFDPLSQIISNELQNQIGQIIKVFKPDNWLNDCIIHFPEYENYKTKMSREYDIEFWSPNKEECEDYLIAKKYNL